jgi:Domain of unknown function (DUF5655)
MGTREVDVWTIERHLEAGTDHGRGLFHRFVEIVASCGEYTTSVAKTTITFKGPRRGFAGARPKGDRLHGYFDVTYRVDDPRISRASPYQKDLFVHHFRVDSPEQMDGEFARWIADAYDQVGCGNR